MTGDALDDAIDRFIADNVDTEYGPDTRSCLLACEQHPGLEDGSFDRSICQSQCLCGTISSPELLGGMIEEGSFRVKFCRIPVRMESVVPNKSVFSLEGVVGELVKVLNNLRYSGELIKHTETKELLETSLQDVKISKLFAFDFVLAIKPLFAQTSRTSIANYEQQQQEKFERGLRQKGRNAEEYERDKYLIVENKALTKAKSQPLNEVGDLEEFRAQMQTIQNRSIPNNRSLVEVESIKGQAVVAEEVIDFINSNAKFRAEFTSLLESFNTTAAHFKAKTDAAN